MKRHTLILLFLVILLFASIWGGDKSKKEKNRSKESADDNLDDYYDDEDDEGENDEYGDDDNDNDDEVKDGKGSDKSWKGLFNWYKKRPCPKIKIPKSSRNEIRRQGGKMKDVLMNWCPEPTKPMNGRVNIRCGVARYRCNPGFDLVGDKTRMCTLDNVWSGSTPHCRANCGPLPSIEHGTLSGNGTLEGDISIAECHPTYFMSSGSAVRTCLNNCTWSGSDAVCTKIDCGNLTDPDNGSVSQTGSKVFDIASYSCDNGYKLVPGVGCQRICLDSGNWSGFKPACIRACAPLSNPENGEVHVTGITEGSFAIYTCNAMYTPTNGSTKRTCTDGEWTGMPVVCSKLDCVYLPPPVHGTITSTDAGVVQISCNLGYELTGSSLRHCHDGSWNGSEPTCNEIDCGTLPAPAFGSVTLTGTVYDDVATYSCNQHYTLEGEPNRKCQLNGTWTGEDPQCTMIDFCPKGADIMFLFDDSSSIGEENFNKQKQFMAYFVESFNVGHAQDEIHFGAVSFANTTYLRVWMRNSNSTDYVIHAMENMEWLPSRGSGRATHVGLDFARLYMWTRFRGDRDCIPNILIVLSSGPSDNSTATEIASNELKARWPNLKIFTIAIGDNADKNEVEKIASKPEMFYSVNGFDDFSSITVNMKLQICQAISDAGNCT